MITARRAVRGPLMRATLHLVTARDYMRRSGQSLRPVLERGFAGSPFDVSGVEIEALLEAGRELIEDSPRSRAELAALLAERWTGSEPAALAQAITYLLPVVQVPPRGVWRAGGQARWTTAEAWLGRGPDAKASIAHLVVRYLGAYGPAMVMDIQAWSGLTRLGEVVDGLRHHGCARFATRMGASCSTSPMRPGPTPTPPRHRASYPSTTTCSSPMRTARASSRAMSAYRSSPEWAGATALFSSTAFSAARGRSRASASARSFRSSRSSRCPTVTPSRDEGARLLAFAAADAADREIRFTI